ncbi:hypothetical protein CBR_g19992 [Chara braunii]|uniref:Uncharacterized protein n=1 Tax=Chara braunii TaxID=69332 RepID=A0A388KZ75_CHABU|nr:hypothetical protein CBR_g19992 [Chara braunii]|eukprot:GBG75360.1 hypothetical protein CBR_g19992 [Chara braunii]
MARGSAYGSMAYGGSISYVTPESEFGRRPKHGTVPTNQDRVAREVKTRTGPKDKDKDKDVEEVGMLIGIRDQGNEEQKIEEVGIKVETWGSSKEVRIWKGKNTSRGMVVVMTKAMEGGLVEEMGHGMDRVLAEDG